MSGISSVRELQEKQILGTGSVHKSAEVGAETVTLWDPTTGSKFVVTDMIVSVSSAATVTIFDGTDTTANRLAKASLAANGGFIHNFKIPFRSSTVDNLLKVTSTAATCYITVIGYEDNYNV